MLDLLRRYRDAGEGPSNDPRIRFGRKLLLTVFIGYLAFVTMMLFSEEAGHVWKPVAAVVVLQALLSFGVGAGLPHEKYFPVVNPLLAVINFSAGLIVLFLCGGYPTPLWMTALFAVYPSAFFLGQAGALINAVVALAGLLGPHFGEIDSAIMVGTAAQVTALLVLGLVASSLFRLVSDAEGQQRQSARQLETANRDLMELLSQRDVDAETKVVLNEMSDLVQSCSNSDEAFAILASYGSRLFPEHSGALFVYRNSRDYLELAAKWGNLPPAHLKMFTSEECWALRRGRPYHVNGRQNEILCHHLEEEWREGAEGLCVPMMAQGEILGVFHLGSSSDATGCNVSPPASTIDETLAVTVARDGALGLANLRLRETLRNQALRDPLTQLYNRRYLEEALPREVHRAERRGHPLALAMLDVDHFKMFNDTYGHEAGDIVLREVGAVLRASTRAEDLACRYGGEEFVVVFVETSRDDAVQRAEGLRRLLAALDIEHGGQTLGRLTVSVGLATMPEHPGLNLLKVADQMLYRAKNEGRNRVVCADAATPSSLPGNQSRA